MKILLVEDDPQIASAISMLLRFPGHVVELADCGEAAVEWARACHFDVALLDLGLPDISCFDVLKRWRSCGVDIASIVLSAASTIEVKVKALSLGADDFMVKPFHRDELFARMDAVTRRGRLRATSMVECGPLVFNLNEGDVYVAGKPLRLSPSLFRFLEALARRQGKIVLRTTLLQAIYRLERTPDDKIIDVFVSKLREALRDAAPGLDFIETRPGFGYGLRASPIADLTPRPHRAERLSRVLAKPVLEEARA